MLTGNINQRRQEQMQCPKCKNAEMWDNRPKKASGDFKPSSPDFKCKDSECGHVIWPPKDGQPMRSVPIEQAKSVPSPSDNGWQDRSSHIERQHSQEMALRYFAIANTIPTTTQLREM